MINCFQLCTIWNYIKYSNKRRKQQYKNAYGEMQQNKHLMKGSEGRNVFFPLLFLWETKHPIQETNSNAKWGGRKSKRQRKSTSEEVGNPGQVRQHLCASVYTSNKTGNVRLHGFQGWLILRKSKLIW